MAKPQDNEARNGKKKQEKSFDKYMIRKNWIAKRKQFRDHYLILYKIFEKHKDKNGKWRFDEETQKAIIREYMRETKQTQYKATKEIAQFLSSRLMRDDPNLLKCYQTFALDNYVWGIEASKQEMDYQNHRGYLGDFSDIVGLVPKEQKEKDTPSEFMMFKNGETEGIVARGNPSEVIKYIQTAIGPKLPGKRKALPQKQEEVTIDVKAEEGDAQTRHNSDRPPG